MSVKIKVKRSVDTLDNLSFDDDDIFSRKYFGENLANLIEHSENQSLVISINAPWGEGKTTFLSKWKNYLISNRNRKVIYFNSFKNDYIEDPFTALLGELIKEFSADQTITNKIKAKGINVLKGILPLAGKIGVRILLGGDIKGVEDRVEELIEGDIIESIGTALKEYGKQENTIKAFKETLEEIIRTEGEIIFIIDELDRCRPDFALRLLERVKHFFDLDGLYFVLGVNKDQLRAYVKNIYGDIDTNKYLQKFIDIETYLPINLAIRNNSKEKYITSLYTEYQGVFTEKNVQDDHHIIAVFKLLAISNDFSLRDIEKSFNYLVLSQKSVKDNRYFSGTLMAILVCLKMLDINYLKRIHEIKLTKEEIIKILNVGNIVETYMNHITDEISFFFDSHIDSEIENKFGNRGWDIDLKSRHRALLDHVSIMDMYNIE